MRIVESVYGRVSWVLVADPFFLVVPFQQVFPLQILELFSMHFQLDFPSNSPDSQQIVLHICL